MKQQYHSRRPPQQVGINSNTGRVQIKNGLPQTIKGRPLGRGARTLNESVAPSCPITRSELPPAQPGIKIPFVPKATDVESAIAAVNKLIDIIAADSEATIRWLEKERTTDIVRITNPDDEDQWVEVERIIRLVMEDQITGDLWLWELGQNNPVAPSAAQILNNLNRMTGAV